MTDKPSELPNWQIYYKDLFDQNEKFRTRDEKQIEEIRLLKTQLELEKRNSRDLKTEKTNFFSKRS